MSATAGATVDPPAWALWKDLLEWSPFKIDALGLVTLLGAEEVNASVGRLVRSTFFEYFPLLGAFVISGNSFRNKEAGFNLYNITQGIHTTDMAAWLTRWMQSQDFESNRSVVRWTVEPRKVPRWEKVLGMTMPFFSIGMLIAMTILSYDWYGFANAISMFLSIVVRCYMVSSIRGAIDKRVKSAYDKFAPHEHATWEKAFSDWQLEDKRASAAVNGAELEAKTSSRPHYLSEGVGWNGVEVAKVLVIMNDAKAVTMLIPRDLLAPPSAFVANLEPPSRAWYGIARWLGWTAFAVQVITIGMADLATQIVTVALLVIPTVLFIARLGCDDSKWWKNIARFLHNHLPESIGNRIPQPFNYGTHWPELKSVSWIGSMLKAEVYEWPRSHEFVLDKDGYVKGDEQLPPMQERPISKRQFLYSWLQLSAEEKKSMDKWDLFPHKRNNNTKWVDVFDQMTERTITLEERGNWGVNSLHPTPTASPPESGQLSTIPAPPQPQRPPQLTQIDTRVPKHHHGMRASKDKEKDEDTVDTAQDGTVLEHNSPSIRTSPDDLLSPRTGHRTSVAFSPSAADVRDNIKPVRRSHTEPAARGRRHSMVAGAPSGSAFWMTGRVNQQQEDAAEETSESDDTVSGVTPAPARDVNPTGEMH